LFGCILLNGLIQPFQQPERVVGFSHRQIYPVARPTLLENAHQFQRSVSERTAARNIPIWKRPRAIGQKRLAHLAPVFSASEREQAGGQDQRLFSQIEFCDKRVFPSPHRTGDAR
jgi:hypothetical protein